eukprot:CAMPEP_0180442588 /NCGR_PEP_ID=MMETSP1036_2-20121128/14222_1 /TAXON_ID=632150 /ORGANISM="Azadinium spinosum, Strain 3D9" /LENGTH=130 /DNA_ID=CAMNT_0022448845 /DNA_START=535 /DNA_END=928 /DNA_ORIENTATION=-
MANRFVLGLGSPRDVVPQNLQERAPPSNLPDAVRALLLVSHADDVTELMDDDPKDTMVLHPPMNSMACPFFPGYPIVAAHCLVPVLTLTYGGVLLSLKRIHVLFDTYSLMASLTTLRATGPTLGSKEKGM